VEEGRFSFETSEGLAIRGDLALPRQKGEPLVVCLHGFKGFKDWGFWPAVRERLAAAGYGALRFNFSHSGVGSDLESFTEVGLFESGTYSREVEDLKEVLTRAAQGRLPGCEWLDVSRIGLLGHSRGSVAALAVAASGEFPIRSVALWNPVSRVLWWDEEERGRWREKGFWEVVNTRTRQVYRMKTALLDDAEKNSGRLDPSANAARIRVPVLSVVAVDDESVPAESGRILVRAAGRFGSLEEISGTGHTFGAVHPPGETTPAIEQAIEATLAHFDRTLKSEQEAA
jgi:dienelactone hydrolase